MSTFMMGIVAIPKSVRKDRILENIDILDFELTKEDLLKIATVDTKTGLFGDLSNPAAVKFLCELKRPT